MSGDTQIRLLATYAQIRHGLEKSQTIVAALDPKALGNDGLAIKAAMLERFAKQINQLRELEIGLIRRIEGKTN